MHCLLSELHVLETSHKSTHLDTDLRELIRIRHEILQLMEHKHKRYQQLCANSFYELGNRSGRLLAHALRNKRASLYIPTIKHPLGYVAHLTEDSLQCFQEYYSSLYNLPAPHLQDVSVAHLTSLAAFLFKISLPKLPSHLLLALEENFTAEELHTVISALPSGGREVLSKMALRPNSTKLYV